MGFPRQEYWSGLQFPCPGDLPDPRAGAKFLSCALTGESVTTEPPAKSIDSHYGHGNENQNGIQLSISWES